MLRVLVCLALTVSPVQTWTASAIFAPPRVLLAPDPDAEWRATLVRLVHVQSRSLAIECIRVRRQRKQRRKRVRRVKRSRRQRPDIVDWRRLKPVLEEIVQETTALVETEIPAKSLTDFSLPVQIVVVTPDYSQTACPKCEGPTKCKRSYYSHPQDIDLEQPTILQVYREVRECRDRDCGGRVAPELDFVAKGGRFTRRAKQKVIDSVVEDGVPITRVPWRMWRDFHVRVAQSTVHEWVQDRAEADLGEAEYTRWVTARFSGVVGIDEVHVRDENGEKQYLVVAVDPINDRTIFFDLIDSRDSDAIAGFLKQLEGMGIDPLVIITDMWKAYHNAILEVFPEAEQQLCVFHVIQAVMKHTNKAMLTYRRELPKETKAQKAVRKRLWKYRYLLLKANHKLSDKQRQRLEEILETHKDTVIPRAYRCKEAILALFRESEDKDEARARRDAILKEFGDVSELKKVLNVIRGDDFEQMIVYLDYENLDKTNNNAERENRTYQKGEKTRYRARKTHTRLNYVKLQARRRNRRSVERNDHLRRKKKRRAFAGRVDAVVEREARRLTA
ncbi:MAG: transposase [Chloroflexota bacterium]|nr:transposase [Chloroflexota bacterium]